MSPHIFSLGVPQHCSLRFSEVTPTDIPLRCFERLRTSLRPSEEFRQDSPIIVYHKLIPIVNPSETLINKGFAGRGLSHSPLDCLGGVNPRDYNSQSNPRYNSLVNSHGSLFYYTINRLLCLVEFSFISIYYDILYIHTPNNLLTSPS